MSDSLIFLLAYNAFMGILTWWFLRGGGIESALLNYKNVPHLKVVAALIFGGNFAWACGDVNFLRTDLAYGPDIGQFIFASIVMFVGSAPGWGKYIAAMAGNSTMGKSKMWGLGRMTLRGLYLGGCVATTWLVGAPVWFSVLMLLCGALMGPVYYLSFNYVTAQGKVFNPWTVAEQVFGWLFWVPLALLAYSKKKKADKAARKEFIETLQNKEKN